MDSEGHSVTLLKRYDLSATLHTRPLFGEDKLSASEVLAGLREKNGDLNRKREIAIEILVETIEVTPHILQ